MMIDSVMTTLNSYEDKDIIHFLCYGMLVSMTGAFIALSLGITAPYGRYSGDLALGNYQGITVVQHLCISCGCCFYMYVLL